MTDENAEERFARRTKGAAYRRLKGEMASGAKLTLPTTEAQLDELERSRVAYYAYIKRAYGLTFNVGERVAFVEEGCPRREGVVTRPIPSAEHYVAVRFDGEKHKSPCHPTSVVPILPASEPTE